MRSLSGVRVLVSGGTTGIGRALVDKLVAVNARVATFARGEEELEALRNDHPKVLTFQADASDEAAMRDVFSKVVAEFGGLDALVNNAAVGGESITSMPYAEWRQVVETNLIGPMLLSQLSLDHLPSGGRIVTVGSMSAKVREEGSDVYVATKSGLRGFTDSFGRAVNPKGIIVTLIEPGLAESDMTTEDKSEEDVRKAKSEDKMMEPEDVARMIVFALSQPSSVEIELLQVRPRAQLI